MFSLDQAIQKQKAELRDVSRRYECDKKLWAATIDDFKKKIKVNYLLNDKFYAEMFGYQFLYL